MAELTLVVRNGEKVGKDEETSFNHFIYLRSMPMLVITLRTA